MLNGTPCGTLSNSEQKKIETLRSNGAEYKIITGSSESMAAHFFRMQLSVGVKYWIGSGKDKINFVE